MIRSRNRTTSLALGVIMIAPLGPSAVRAGDGIEGPAVRRIADRCAQFGEGFADVGNGLCGRVGGHARVYVGTRNAGMTTWTSGSTSSAAMRSDGMVPGAEAPQHLRVRGGLDSYNPFR